MPSSRVVGRIRSSTSRVQSEYSVCRAEIGCTAWARRTVSGAASERPEIADLALLDELGHGSDGLLDGHVRVDAMLVVEVDVLDAETLKRGVAGLMHVLGIAAHAQALAVLTPHVGELGRQHDLVAATVDGPADEALVGERAVHVGRVEQGHAELQRAMDGGDRLLVVASRRRTRTCPCSRAPASKPRVPGYRAFGSASSLLKSNHGLLRFSPCRGPVNADQRPGDTPRQSGRGCRLAAIYGDGVTHPSWRRGVCHGSATPD